MRNSAELHSFSSPHPSFFSEFLVQFLDSNEKGMEARAYIGWETPCRPWGGLSPIGGGDRTPSLHTPPARDLFANSKKITLRSCRPLLGRQDPCRPWGGRPGAIFEIFQNGHIFLKFLFFLNIKKKKTLLRTARTAGLAQRPKRHVRRTACQCASM